MRLRKSGQDKKNTGLTYHEAVEAQRRLAVYLHRRHRQAEMERKRSYIALYLPHLALGVKQILELSDRQETAIVSNLNQVLERTHLDV